MDLEKELLRRLKIEVSALEAAMKQKDRRLLQLEEERKLLESAVLKFGSMVGPKMMELKVSGHGLTSPTISVIDHSGCNTHTIQLRWT